MENDNYLAPTDSAYDAGVPKPTTNLADTEFVDITAGPKVIIQRLFLHQKEQVLRSVTFRAFRQTYQRTDRPTGRTDLVIGKLRFN